MSIEKYLNKIDNIEIANEGIGVFAAGVLAAPFILSAGLIAIAPLLAKYGLKHTENIIERANVIKISKTTIIAMNLYINNAMSFKNKADNLFNKGIELLTKYGLKIPDNIHKSFLNETNKLNMDVKKFHYKINDLVNTKSDIVDDISLKSKVIKLNEISHNCYSSRVNDDDLGEEFDQIPSIAKLMDDDEEYDRSWHYGDYLVQDIVACYRLLSYTIPKVINNNINIKVEIVKKK